MKNPIRILLMILVVIILWRCADQQPDQFAPRAVQFTVRTAASAQNGRVAAVVDLPAGTELLLSIRKSTGEAVLTHKRVALLKIGSGYVSDAISLYPGSYLVVDFMLVHGSEALYATPQATSPLASLVTSPLPYGFTVSADALLTLDAEVISTTATSPEQFGYASFNITIKDTESIQIEAYANESGDRWLTDGEAFIMDGYDTLVHTALMPTTNDVPFTGDPTAVYNLVVLRHGYMRYKRQFTYNDLHAELDGNPLQVDLTPGVTYVTINQTFTLCGIHASLHIGQGPTGKAFFDFGEPVGIPAQWNFGPFLDSDVWHDYARREGGDYFVCFNGDLEKLELLHPMFNIDTLDVSHMPRLKQLAMRSELVLRAIDLTHNDSLEIIDFGNAAKFRSADLSRICPIREVSIENTVFTPTSLTDLIDDVYAAVVHNNTHGGTFNYTNLERPSSQAVDQLKALKNQYGWTVTPNP